MERKLCCSRLWPCAVGLALLAGAGWAEAASPLFQYHGKTTAERYQEGLTALGDQAKSRAPIPQGGGERQVTDPVECATDYVWCPSNPAIGCDTSPTWCFQTDPATCATNVEWCQTNVDWGCAPTDPAYGCWPTDPQYCQTDPSHGCWPTDPQSCQTDFQYCQTDIQYCNTDQFWCDTDYNWCATDPYWCPTDPQNCFTDPQYCPTDPQYCFTDPQYCPTDPSVCFTDPQNCATDPMYCFTDPVYCPVVGADDRPVGLELRTPQPNPFNPFTTLSFTLPETGRARLTVYDLRGRQVKVLVDGLANRGLNTVLFDGSQLPSGLYVYVLEAAGVTLQDKMLLVK
jgi:hypothetical protein